MGTPGSASAAPDCDVAVIILTANEEANIGQALDSVSGWARQVFVLDSHSTDKTLEIAARYQCSIHQRVFDDFGKQRNYALESLPLQCEWVFFLDADEWLSDALKREIAGLVVSKPGENGFLVNRRFIWMRSWIKRGYYPSWILRLFRRGTARCEDRGVNEHILVDGRLGHLRNDLMHEDRKGIAAWIGRHNNYSTLEALELVKRVSAQSNNVDVRFWGTQAERKRWLRQKVWVRMPPLVRPFCYFFYRYVLTGGCLDGRAAFAYHFLQALWFPMLTDIKYLEAKWRDRGA